MHAINDGYRGLQLLVTLNSDRVFFVLALVAGLLAGTFGAGMLSALN